MKNKICCIFNLAPHYRAPIYRLMDEKLNCDFYFGDTLENQIKLMDYESLKGFKKIVKNKSLTKTGFMWQKGVVSLIFKPYKYYIITGSPSILSNWVLSLTAKILGKKVFAWSHGMKNTPITKGELFNKYFYKIVDKVLLYGDFSKNVMLSEGFRPNQLVPIYNSLDHSAHIEIRKSLAKNSVFQAYFKNDYPVIIYIGRIQKSKKLDLLVGSVRKLLDKNIKCNLVFVGADIENSEIFELVDELELNKNVWKYGPCYDEAEIGNLFFNASLCVSPGPVGLTALHALTFGCPVITNDNFEKQMPEHEAIVPGINGDFYEDGNFNSLVELIEKWIKQSTVKEDSVRNAAFKVIDEKWNPNYQLGVLKNLID